MIFQKYKITVAGKKGKMMERRILKDFQIGIVEGIVNEVVQGSKEVKDVFSSIAKAIGKKSIKKEGYEEMMGYDFIRENINKNVHRKEDWNAIVRKNTTIRDPIGSTSASINRKDRLSLRRHILETANQGLQMDTEKLVRKFQIGDNIGLIRHLKKKIIISQSTIRNCPMLRRELVSPTLNS